MGKRTFRVKERLRDRVKENPRTLSKYPKVAYTREKMLRRGGLRTL